MLILRQSRNQGLKNKWRSNMRTVCPKCHGEVGKKGLTLPYMFYCICLTEEKVQ